MIYFGRKTLLFSCSGCFCFGRKFSFDPLTWKWTTSSLWINNFVYINHCLKFHSQFHSLLVNLENHFILNLRTYYCRNSYQFVDLSFCLFIFVVTVRKTLLLLKVKFENKQNFVDTMILQKSQNSQISRRRVEDTL